MDQHTNFEVLKYLIEIDCCPRCILLYLGERKLSNYESDASVNLLINNIVKSDQSIDKELQSDVPKNGHDNCEEDDHFKRIKRTICTTCLGLFQDGISTSAIDKMRHAMLDGGYDADDFGINLSLPISLGIRVQSVWVKLISAYPQCNSKHRNDHLTVMKEIWKNTVGPKLSSISECQYVTGQNVEFCLNVSPGYSDDKKDCSVLDTLCKNKFVERRKHHKKFNEGVYTRQSVEDTFRTISNDHFLKLCPDIPTEPAHSLVYNEMSCSHTSIYLAGRYNKYSRELSQTPWLVEGERRMQSSVQELICNILNDVIKPDSMKFSSSGREDVDVRCLGKGRPFVVEFLNPHHVKLKREEVVNLQEKVNKTTDLVAIRDLQVVSKADIGRLKEGEEEKTKSYAALCFIRSGMDDGLLKKLDDLGSIVLQQTTPLRVLHRRPLAIRPRIIHSISATGIDKHYFKLYLTTQAGTYVKEFVHGDFGRTTPNLGSLLDVKVDIVALDVENVQLDWPPSSET